MNELPVKIYTPQSELADPKRLLKSMWQDLKGSRELAWRLAVRDINSHYRQTYFGFLWALITPLSNTLVWIFLSSSGVVKIADTGVPYPVYVFVGTMLWSIFIEALNAPLQGTQSASGMLAKINFPREAIIISGIYQSLFNSGIKLTLILIALVFLGFGPGLFGLFMPFGIASLILAGTVLGLFLTPMGLLYGDIGKGIPLLAQFAMYVTPVVYPLPQEGYLRDLLYLNPLMPIIMTVRDLITGHPPEFMLPFLLINIALIIFLIVVWTMYRLAMPILIERMSA